MTFKQFYLISLIGITFFGFIILFLIWLSNKKDDKNRDNKGLLYIALAFLSWTFNGIYKFQDIHIINLSTIIGDRVISSFSNLFLIASLPYFTNTFNHLRLRYSFFRNRDQWVINVFITFTILTAIFSYADKQGDNLTPFFNYLILIIDCLISIGTFSLVSFALYKSLTKVIFNRSINIVFIIIFFLLPITQIILPLTKVFPDQLRFLYPFTLALFLLSISCFICIINAYFLLYFSFVKNAKSINIYENNPLLEQEVISVNKIEFSFNDTTKNYVLSISILDNFNKESVIIKSYSKLMKPLAHWFLFSVSKKNNVFLSENDISVTKFRMIEFFNKDSELKINQEQIFSNNGGSFSLKLDPENIVINNPEVFKKSYIFQEIFKKHAICFIPKQEIDKENLKNSKLFEKYMTKNFDRLYESIFN
jgi:hypothetical protein